MVTKEGSYSFREDNRAVLTTTFRNYIKPLISREDPRVLSVGCCFGLEAKPILDLFPAAVFLGIDIDANSIRGAMKMNEDIADRVEFRVADATESDTLRRENGWDLVIVRHPQIITGVFQKTDWSEILKNCFGSLNETGILFVTTQDIHEREAVLRELANDGASILINELNPNPSPGPFPDFDIIVAKKT